MRGAWCDLCISGNNNYVRLGAMVLKGNVVTGCGLSVNWRAGTRWLSGVCHVVRALRTTPGRRTCWEWVTGGQWWPVASCSAEY